MEVAKCTLLSKSRPGSRPPPPSTSLPQIQSVYKKWVYHIDEEQGLDIMIGEDIDKPTVMMLMKNLVPGPVGHTLSLPTIIASYNYYSSLRMRRVHAMICPHVFSRTVAVVDTKRGHVQLALGTAGKSGAALSQKHFYGGGLKPQPLY